MEVDGLAPALFRDQAGFHRPQCVVTQSGGLETGLGGRRVEVHEGRPLFHGIAFFHVDGFDDAAGEVLHGFSLGVDRHHAGSGHSFVQRRERRPQQEAAKTNRQHPEPESGGRVGIRGQAFFFGATGFRERDGLGRERADQRIQRPTRRYGCAWRYRRGRHRRWTDRQVVAGFIIFTVHCQSTGHYLHRHNLGRDDRSGCNRRSGHGHCCGRGHRGPRRSLGTGCATITR